MKKTKEQKERHLAQKREWARKWRLRMGMRVIGPRTLKFDLVAKDRRDGLCNVRDCREKMYSRGCCIQHYSQCWYLIKKNIVSDQKLVELYVFNEPNASKGYFPPHKKKTGKVMMYADYLKIEKKRRKRERKLFTGVTRQGIVMRYTKKHE